MASKVLVKIPAVNFNTQVGKCSPDLGPLPGSSNVNGGPRITLSENVVPSTEVPGSTIITNTSSDPTIRIAQLEQNIRFLKEQHHVMLTSLHQEVESLRQRNRDFQFQLVFSRGSLALVKSTPSSPEDDSKPQILLSPKQVNVTPLQVEILERDVAELRTSLSEARTRNAYLQNIVDEQQKQLESAAQAESSEEANPTSKSPDPDLTFKLEEAEKVIRRLRRENDEQRRELAVIKANQIKAQGGPAAHAHSRGGHYWGQQQREYQGHHRRDQHHEVEQHHEPQQPATRFPPLPTQKYWHSNGHSGRRWNHSWDSGRGASSGPQGPQGPRMHNQSVPSLPALPHAPHAAHPVAASNSSSAPPHAQHAHFTLLGQGGAGPGAAQASPAPGRRGHRGNRGPGTAWNRGRGDGPGPMGGPMGS